MNRHLCGHPNAPASVNLAAGFRAISKSVVTGNIQPWALEPFVPIPCYLLGKLLRPVGIICWNMMLKSQLGYSMKASNKQKMCVNE